jgi:hydrogenase nickel incorporation protein HypB
MCTTCGCGEGDTRIEGKPLDVHEHAHQHADGTVHAHQRRHEGEHAHEPAAAPAGEHWHRHPDGTLHSHVHGGGSAHGHDRAPAAALLDAVHAPGTARERIVRIEQDILAKNDACARENRRYFADRGIFALNLVSSPGSGKTTLLVRTIEAWQGRTPVAVIEGDQQTSRDADRVRATGAAAIQINTGKGCHLDAHMVGQALEELEPADGGLLLIENVGNLVCPAAFDLGEAHKVVVLSATEGEDKPLKYPDMFRAADLMLINKADLLPYLRFDTEAAIDFARRVRPGLEAMLVSAQSGQGFDAWLAWLERGVDVARRRRDESLEYLRRRIAQLEAELAGRPGSPPAGS